MMNRTKKTIHTVAIMSRVSSDEQALGYSLGVQEESLTNYAERHQYNILYRFREDHSAKDFKRPEFQKFLALIKSGKLKIDALLFTSWDRFSRNVTDAFVMIRELEGYGVTVQGIEQPLDLSIPENLTVLGIYLTLPEVDNKRRSIKIRGGVRAALKEGRYPRLAPIGYKNSRDEKNKPIIVFSEDADHIRYLFRQIRSGVSQIDVRQALKKRGLSLDKSVVSRLLRNPVYIGKIEVPAEGDEPYMLVDGLHDALIDAETFHKVQLILDGRAKARQRPNSNRRREELALRGLIHCKECGKRMTGSPSRSKMGLQYFYYHCNHCGKDRVRADVFNEIIQDILGAIKFNKTAEQMFSSIMQEKLKKRTVKKGTLASDLEKKLELSNVKLKNVQDLLASGAINPNEYREMKSRYETEKQELEKLLKPATQENP